jgi:Zn-dependent protease
MIPDLFTRETLFLVIIFVISIGLHEYAHAWASVKLGDPTPALQGRFTPNPLAHIDPLWLVLIFLIGFGRGKPVIVNPAYYKHHIRDELLVAMAWPASNILMAIASIIIIMIYAHLVWFSVLTKNSDMIVTFWRMFGVINVMLAVFNLLPFPPLDWRRLIKFFLPSVARTVAPYTNYLMIGLLVVLFMPGISGVVRNFLGMVTQGVYGTFFMLIAVIFV